MTTTSANKHTIYLLPGLLCDETVWEHQQKSLEDKFIVKTPNFRGFSSFRTMAESVAAIAPATFSIVGHSMGGRVALELLDLCPERIEKVVLLSFGAHPVAEGEPEKRMASVAIAEQEGMEILSNVWIPPMLSAEKLKDESLFQAIKTMVLKSTSADYRGQINAALTRTNQWEYLKNISQEVLLICGEHDGWSPVHQHEAILDALNSGQARAKLEIVPNAGHMVTMEQPETVSRLLLNWFSL